MSATNLPIDTPIAASVNGEPLEGWLWCSFTDPTRPTGDQFLGVVITEKFRFAMGLGLFGLNPGGQIAVVEIPAEHLPAPEWRNRILTKAEAEAL